MEITIMFFKLIVSLIVILGLMGITFKFANKGFKKVNGDKYINIIDRVQIGKDVALVVVKFGEEGFLMSVSNGKTEKLKELTKEEIEKIEEYKAKKQEDVKIYYSLFEDKIKNGISTMKEKIGAKEEKNG